MTFLDLSNAFGSISHQLIADMLRHTNIPAPVISYIKNASSQLQGFASSPNWTTDVFPIERGIFQGDTLSPMIFLIAINPVIKFADKERSSGFSLKYPVPSSVGLPPVNAHIYVEWNEPSSDEPPGWYRCSVTEHSPTGLTSVRYANGRTESGLDLHTVGWHLATGNSRHFLPGDNTPPDAKVPKVRAKLQDTKFFSTGFHRSKAYCDDLSLISSMREEHKSTLRLIDSHCQDLDLHLKPSKCISLAFDGKRIVSGITFPLSSGHTTNIHGHPTKFLGKALADCPKVTRKSASLRLKSLILPQLTALDQTQIRREYKSWILNHSLLPSLHFHLMVNDILKSHVYSLQRALTRMVKKWLHLPRCSTPSVVFHPNSLDLKFLPLFLEEAKMSLLTTVSHSCDPQVLECLPSLQDPSYLKASYLDPKVVERFECAVAQCRAEGRLLKRPQILAACKKKAREKQVVEWENHLSQLTVQNGLLDILPLGAEDHLWKRLFTGMPAGQLSFVLRASCDCLPCPSSLVRWGYSMSRKCPLCTSPFCNVHHVLNCCPTALTDGRYTWRHDMVLAVLLEFLKEFNPSANVYADLPNHRACESPPATIPPAIIGTTARPDAFVVDGKRATILELTVPWNNLSSLKNARARKHGKANYQLLASDLSAQEYQVQLETIEIGCLGHYTNDAYSALKVAAPQSKASDRRNTLTNAAKAAISASYRIFSGWRSPWSMAA